MSKKYYNNTNLELEIKPSNIINAGNGVFLSEHSHAISPNTLIGYYHGKFKFGKNTMRTPYSFYINDSVFLEVDMNYTPFTAILNDAYNSSFSNNCDAIVLVKNPELINKKNSKNYNPEKIVAIYSTKTIMPCDELFFAYGDYYWNSAL